MKLLNWKCTDEYFSFLLMFEYCSRIIVYRLIDINHFILTLSIFAEIYISYHGGAGKVYGPASAPTLPLKATITRFISMFSE